MSIQENQSFFYFDIFIFIDFSDYNVKLWLMLIFDWMLESALKFGHKCSPGNPGQKAKNKHF